MHRGGEADGVSRIIFSKYVEHSIGGTNDARWNGRHADTTLNNNELLGIEKVVYLLIPSYPCPGEFLNWLQGC